MDASDLELSRPCPIDLDDLGVDRSQPQVFCAHCQATVTDISKMREAEAAAFVAERRGSGVCISYLRDAAGNVLFADSPRPRPAPALVPAARLIRPKLRRAAAIAALSLAACTPHGEILTADDGDLDEIAVVRSAPEIPDVAEPEYTPPPHVQAPEPDEVEPCEPESTDDAPSPEEITDKRIYKRRGGLRKVPKKQAIHLDRVDGGI
jgi:hypothetical protein